MNDTKKPKPSKPLTEALYDFLCMAKDRSQSLIIRFFLEQVIERSDVCEQGSLLLHMAAEPGSEEKLVLWDAATNANSVARLLDRSLSFPIHEGLAGLAFRKRTAELAPVAREHPQFVPIQGQDIGAIYCAPVLLGDRPEPFGVVSFHNTVGGNRIETDRQMQMDLSVKTLEAALAVSQQKLVPRERVFIVHGRDEKFRKELESILAEEGIKYCVIQALARTGQDLLAFLERQIRDCIAGFVLLTPDDEGRLYSFGEPLRQRARQNVIFEGGYLTALFRNTQRVCFLQLGDLEIPSDMNGLLMERFSGPIDGARIRLTLREWGLGRSAGDAKAQDARAISGISCSAPVQPTDSASG
jgi:predicted nucleotide-binding protein